MLKIGAWSVPVIATAVAMPAAVASDTTLRVACIAVPTGEFTVVGGPLMADGRIGTLPAKDGHFGTGWTPPIRATGDWQTGFTQSAQSVDPTPASWWQGKFDTSKPGFMSLDDNDNRDDAPKTPGTVELRFVANVQAGLTYDFVLPIYTGAAYLGTQYVNVAVTGAGVSIPTAAQGYVGTPGISMIPAGFEAYPELLSEQSPRVSFTPTESGEVSFTYTFTLAYVTGGNRQNADIVVQAPQFQSCF